MLYVLSLLMCIFRCILIFLKEKKNVYSNSEDPLPQGHGPPVLNDSPEMDKEAGGHSADNSWTNVIMDQ